MRKYNYQLIPQREDNEKPVKNHESFSIVRLQEVGSVRMYNSSSSSKNLNDAEYVNLTTPARVG